MIDVTNTAALERVIAAPDEYEDTEDMDEQLTGNLREVIDSLRSATRLLDYLADPNLVTKISKRERDIITRYLDTAYTLINRVEEELTEA